MRTTLRLDDDLLAEAKVVAARRRTTLTALVEEALRERLGRAAAAPADTAPLPVSRQTGGTRAGVDLDDGAALLDLLDSGEDAGRRR
jgi:hypothetical protein